MDVDQMSQEGVVGRGGPVGDAYYTFGNDLPHGASDQPVSEPNNVSDIVKVEGALSWGWVDKLSLNEGSGYILEEKGEVGCCVLGAIPSVCPKARLLVDLVGHCLPRWGIDVVDSGVFSVHNHLVLCVGD